MVYLYKHDGFNEDIEDQILYTQLIETTLCNICQLIFVDQARIIFRRRWNLL